MSELALDIPNLHYPLETKRHEEFRSRNVSISVQHPNIGEICQPLIAIVL